MLHVLVPSLTPRLRYTFNLIFNTILKTPYQLTDSEPDYKTLEGPKLSYGKLPVSHGLFFSACDLLFEEKIHQQNIQTFYYNHQLAFFKQEHPISELPYDLFALVFYLVSRYEEYMPSNCDIHGRFPADQSLAYRENFLELPLINLHVNKLRTILSEKFSQLELHTPCFTFQPTFDIDYAWAYKHKGFFRSSAALLREILSGKIKAAENRIQTVLGKQPDPYFTFEQLYKIHKQSSNAPIFFFLVGSYGKYDKNVSMQVPAFQELIQAISHTYPIGLHPSYRSHVSKKQLKKELLKLSTVTAKTVTKSRQHFLKFQLPETYRRLEDMGITDEYSMGYPDAIGFRASIATPFLWFDLEANRVTSLKVHPFQVMDVTLNHYLRLSPENAIKKIESLINITRDAGGEFCSVWHNNSFYFEGPWKGWNDVYLKLIEATRC